MKNQLVRMAQYNQWMNNKLYTVAMQVSAEDLVKDQGAFFKSILGTLNHIMVADVLWFKRMASHEANFANLQLFRDHENPGSLKEVLYADISELCAERQRMDNAILAFVAALSEDELNSELDYCSTEGSAYRDRLEVLLQHVFNHATHHRGQLTTLYNQMGLESGLTDLMWMLREQEAAA